MRCVCEIGVQRCEIRNALTANRKPPTANRQPLTADNNVATGFSGSFKPVASTELTDRAYLRVPAGQSPLPKPLRSEEHPSALQPHSEIVYRHLPDKNSQPPTTNRQPPTANREPR